MGLYDHLIERVPEDFDVNKIGFVLIEENNNKATEHTAVLEIDSDSDCILIEEEPISTKPSLSEQNCRPSCDNTSIDVGSKKQNDSSKLMRPLRHAPAITLAHQKYSHSTKKSSIQKYVCDHCGHKAIGNQNFVRHITRHKK